MTNQNSGISVFKKWVFICGQDLILVRFEQDGTEIQGATTLVTQETLQAHVAQVAACHGTVASETWERDRAPWEAAR